MNLLDASTMQPKIVHLHTNTNVVIRKGRFEKIVVCLNATIVPSAGFVPRSYSLKMQYSFIGSHGSCWCSNDVRCSYDFLSISNLNTSPQLFIIM